jgi:hypothetical protein
MQQLTLPFRNGLMTVHLDQQRHFGFLCTFDDEPIGILYKSGILFTFEDSEYTAPVEWQKTSYIPPFEGWWKDEFDNLIDNNNLNDDEDSDAFSGEY